MSFSVAIIKTGVANTASMMAGFERVDAVPALCVDPEIVREAPYVVLPGVGSFGAGIAALHEMKMVDVLKERIMRGAPTLAVCVGLQLLFEESEESPEAEGLGIVKSKISRFSPGVRVPQLGWNLLTATPECRILSTGYAYFANSYRAVEADKSWSLAHAEHGGQFIAGMERGAVVAAQFHPELSGAWGLSFFRRWLVSGASAGSREC